MKSLEYNPQLDGLRWFAVLGVLLCHFVHFDYVYWNRLPFGQGVDLFFVLSGYLITNILFINKEKVQNKTLTKNKFFKSFYFRRSLRIFPIYYLLIAYLLIIDFQNTRDVWEWIVFYASNFYISMDYPYIGSFNHLWSLAVEEQFYMIWPFLIFYTSKKHVLKVISAGFICSILFKIIYYQNYGASTGINALTISCMDSLCLGSFIGYMHMYRPTWLNYINEKKWLIISSFLLFAFFRIYPRPYEAIAVIANNFLFSVFAFFLVAKISQKKSGKIGAFLLENRFFIYLGKISYGIYLYHFFMPDFYNQIVDWFPSFLTLLSWIKTPFLFSSSIMIATISWFLLEKPLLSLKNKDKSEVG